MSELKFQKPWGIFVSDDSEKNVTNELRKEISSAHSLWQKIDKVIGRSYTSDDVLIRLNDGKFAVVHLTWKGKIDQLRNDIPTMKLFQNKQAAQNWLDEQEVDE